MLSALPKRTRIVAAVVVVVASAALAAFFVLRGRRAAGSGQPLDAVPRDSFLVATVNVTELHHSPLYDVLVGKDTADGKGSKNAVLDRRALGIGKLADACGFDPLSRVESLAVGVPEEGDRGEIGVAARVTVNRDELTKCTENLASERGGKMETKDVGSFTVVEDVKGQETAARPRLAYGGDRLLLVGRGAWFDAMIAAADHNAPSARDAAAHATMRSSLTKRDGWGAPTVVVTALLPRSLRDRIKNEMGADVLGSKSPDESQNVMAGVLGVSTVGLALRAGPSGGTIDAAVELVCDTDDGCKAVEKLISKKRFEWAKELTYRMVGLGPLLDSIDVKLEDKRIRVTAGAAADALAATIDRVLRLKARSRASEEAPPSIPPTRPSRPGDETIPAAPKPSH